MAGLNSIFSTPLGQAVLVFILVFTLVYAILQKTKLLGDSRKQSDALVALAVGLLVISVGYAVDIITGLIPVLAIGLVIILVFMLLWGFFYKDAVDPHWGVKLAAGIIAFIAVVIAILQLTPAWDYLYLLITGNSSALLGNIILIIVVIVAIIIAVVGGKSGDKKDKKD